MISLLMRCILIARGYFKSRVSGYPLTELVKENKMKKILIISLILFNAAALSALYSEKPYLAVLTSSVGSPKIKRQNKNIQAIPGIFIQKNDIISLSKGEKINLILKNGRLKKLSGPYKGRINTKYGKTQWYSKLAEGFLSETTKLISMETLRTRAEKRDKLFVQLYPYNSYLLEQPIVFQWRSNSNNMRFFKLNVYKEDFMEKNPVRIDTTRIGKDFRRYKSRLKYRENQTYSWNIIGKNKNRWVTTKRCFFLVINKKLRRKIITKIKILKRMKKQDEKDMVPYIIGTLLLMKEKLYHMAIDEINKSIKLNPKTPFPYTLRGRIFEEMNLQKSAAKDYITAGKYSRS